MLIQFVDDNIDQTPQLASTLNAASVTTSSVDGKSQVTVRMLPGDHVRPLRQAFGDLPPEIAQVAEQAVTQGSYFLQGLSNMATQAGFAEVQRQGCNIVKLLLSMLLLYISYIAKTCITAALYFGTPFCTSHITLNVAWWQSCTSTCHECCYRTWVQCRQGNHLMNLLRDSQDLERCLVRTQVLTRKFW